MKWAYRRKDYFFPRSIREAYGYDETYEPPIRCCSELFYEKPSKEEFLLDTVLPLSLIFISLTTITAFLIVYLMQ